MTEVDGVKYYTIEDMVNANIASRRTIHRRIKDGVLPSTKNLNGKVLVKVDDIKRLLKRNTAA